MSNHCFTLKWQAALITCELAKCQQEELNSKILCKFEVDRSCSSVCCCGFW